MHLRSKIKHKTFYKSNIKMLLTHYEIIFSSLYKQKIRTRKNKFHIFTEIPEA